jgi:hypothetical protein
MPEQIVNIGETSGDAYLDVTFYKGLHNEEEVDFIRIGVPGDKTITIDTIADDGHKARFRQRYDAYIGYRDMQGHPIDEWDEIAQNLRTELAYQGFKFVEQIAGAPDAAFARMMGGVQIRTKAQSFLNRGKIGADIVIAKQADQIQELQEKINLLLEMANEKPITTTKKKAPPTTE